MNLSTITNLFAGSPYKTLLHHRAEVLRGLKLLNRQLQNLPASAFTPKKKPYWVSELACLVLQAEKDLSVRLQQSYLTTHQTDKMISELQIQSNLARLTCTLAERLSYNITPLSDDLNASMKVICSNFSKAVYHLCYGVTEQESSNRSKKSQSYSLDHACQQLIHFTTVLEHSTHNARKQIYNTDTSQNQINTALLLLILQDIEDLSLWMRSLLLKR